MPRETGIYRITTTHNETVRAFVPHPLPPDNPPLVIQDSLARALSQATIALERLRVATVLVPNVEWFLYGFVRREAVLSSQIEGTQATLQDVARFEATDEAERPHDVEEVCNYIAALNFALEEIARPGGLPLSTRLLSDTHRMLMRGVRGADKSPGEIRRTQNWVGGTRPGNAVFVPPPPQDVGPSLADLEKWLHSNDGSIVPLVRVGLAHVQFETIHPFLDGNGRIGRVLITLLIRHWQLLEQPLLYLSVALKRHQREYYARLSAVRTDGDWEGWTAFFLDCVTESANDAVRVAGALHRIVAADRAKLFATPSTAVNALRLLEALPVHPIVTMQRVVELLHATKPTASKAIEELVSAGVLHETTGKQRDREYVYRAYLDTLTGNEPTQGPR